MKNPLRALSLLLLVPLLAVTCTGGNSTAPVNPTPNPNPDPGPTPRSFPPITFVGAGDIADCAARDGGANTEATAKLIDRISDGIVFTAGDNAYFDATAADFANCYAPRWGRFRNRTYPAPGNHEYQINSAPYFDYFGERAGLRGDGFYSYSLGNWHIIALNSNIDAGPGSPQLAWLTRDLQDNKRVQNATGAKCTLAYWHHPLFTSGPSAGSNAVMLPVWRVLHEYGVDVVVNGHDHLYERFEPMDPTGRRDPTTGIREYVVGTGGAPLYDFGPALPTSAARLKLYGVLRLTLRDLGWDSAFIQAGTELQLDLTTGNLCH
jgi:hypothetical protein